MRMTEIVSRATPLRIRTPSPSEEPKYVLALKNRITALSETLHGPTRQHGADESDDEQNPLKDIHTSCCGGHKVDRE